MCLALWCRSPRGYAELRNSNFMILSSQQLLQKYKNIVHQQEGINKDVLHWMVNEARLKNNPPPPKVLKVVLLLMRCPYSQTFSLKNEQELYN
jgi:hypothetical protein